MRVGLMATSLFAEEGAIRDAEYLFKQCGGNTGNFAFVYALAHQLGPQVALLPWWATGERIEDTCDLLVIACANQLGRHTDLGMLADNLEGANVPVLAVGLGAQASPNMPDIELTAGTKRWLDVIASRAPSSSPNIAVRGEYTLTQLERLGHKGRGVVVGCPSNFINPSPDLGSRIQQKARLHPERVAVPAGLHLWSHLRQLERALAALVVETDGLYVAQSELDMLRLAFEEFDAIDPPVLEIMRDYTCPDLTLGDFKRWCRRYAVAFLDAGSWMSAMQKYDFVIGPRFHGVMLGIQAGTAGGVIAHDSRTIELCQTTMIPYCLAQDINPDQLTTHYRDILPFDGAKYDENRKARAAAYHSVLSSAGLKSTNIENLARGIS